VSPRAEALGSARYVSLATFRRDGREVRTPVWLAPCDDSLYVYTNAKSGKAKRLRHTPRARIARCDVRGRCAPDVRWRDVVARVVDDPALADRAFAALRAKYGWQMALLVAGAKLSGAWRDRAILELSPA